MGTTYAATARISITATPERVWDALTNPRLIKQYLFGTEAISDWKVGSSITYRGTWEGKPYEDKGKILSMVPNKLFKASYWSAAFGREDKPENYLIVTYEISESDGATTLSITTDNNPSQAGADHSASNWSSVLEKLKALLEA